MLEVIRDILQSRYLRSYVAHKQLARTSLIKPCEAKFSTDRGAVSLKFFGQKVTLQGSERIKNRIVVHWMEFQALKSLRR